MCPPPPPLELSLACPSCGAAVEVPDLAAAPSLSCPCGWTTPRRADVPDPEGRVIRCPACGDPRLYVQKDFSRQVGVGLLAGGFLLAVGLGALLGPWGFFGTLAASVGLDSLLYLVAGQVVICHWCEAHVRGGPEAYPAFDLELHDVIRHQKEVAAAGHPVPDHEGAAAPGTGSPPLHPTRYDG